MRTTLLLLAWLMLALHPQSSYADVNRSSSDPDISRDDGTLFEILDIGLQLGTNVTRWVGKDTEDTANEFVTDVRFVGGFSLGISITSWFSVRPEVLFTRKGPDLLFRGMDDGGIRLSYLEVPALACIQLPWRARLPRNLSLKPYLMGGPWISWLLSAKREHPQLGSRDIKDALKDVDYGLTVGGGIVIGPAWWGAVELNARYDFGISQVGDQGERDDAKNRTISIMLGVRCCAHKPPARLGSEPEPDNDVSPDATSTNSKPGEDAAPNDLPDGP